ncbi:MULTISPECIES: TetR/AcrR family transcriptional regulator [Gordonia]|jgi:AcrR family transcriptional regulator|uniref:TetR/AcrR family transcriptional regulator n=2 Tax=Gordonia terrae TaxID=2055 RepID=A0AAD0P1H5_9ACTN|nr:MULTISPECIES: TetR/AcrR family transcriptional regulator [Gordonia]VTR11504.1 TetR family transcriptional regulator [Clostridioides difficile]ANY26211.1 TetR family transcriptional regulator [Gordonia terrae]AWO86949.1 TetR/AcrR family transcriptional regulator [Gordonia terrae]MCG7631318.1 TetR/AcrR family transcriptional regulator [Gordonia sp. McavH-238-E]UPW08101.1 TetR/AcrR family transcriptional regulator [Gordonia terrae]
MARRKTGNVLSEDVDEARKQIMVAAERVFQRYGVAKTTMDDIGKEAGVSRPTVYRYFKDRDALMSALIERRSRLLFDKARKYLLEHETFADQLVEGLIFLVERGRRDPLIRILVSPEHMQLAESLVGSSGLAARLTAEMWDPIIERAMDRGEIRRDLDKEKIAEWIALVQFILVGRLDFDRPDDPQHREMLHNFVLPAFMPTVVPAAAQQQR